MKIAVINFSGNVGKSTIAAHLLHPRIPGAQIISVESLNIDARDDGVDIEQVRGSQFLEMINDVITRDAVIVDVGASNAEDFMRGMRSLEGSHEEFDYFVVPTVYSKKQLGDTIHTVDALAALGIPSNKIRVLFNKVDADDDVLIGFAALFAFARKDRCFVVNMKAVVYANEVFERLKGVGKSLADIRADETPWRKLVGSASSDAARDHAIAMLTLKRLSGSAGANLDTAYAELFA